MQTGGQGFFGAQSPAMWIVPSAAIAGAVGGGVAAGVSNNNNTSNGGGSSSRRDLLLPAPARATAADARQRRLIPPARDCDREPPRETVQSALPKRPLARRQR